MNRYSVLYATSPIQSDMHNTSGLEPLILESVLKSRPDDRRFGCISDIECGLYEALRVNASIASVTASLIGCYLNMQLILSCPCSSSSSLNTKPCYGT